MKGRQENERSTEILIKKFLINKPKYLHDYCMMLEDKSYTTRLQYLRYIVCLIDYLENEYDLNLNNADDFKQVKVSMIKAYMNYIKYKSDGTEMSHSIRASKFYGIKSFFDFLVNDEYVQNNPCDKIKLQKDKDEHKITSLTKEEICQIKQNIINGVGNEDALKKQKKWKSRDMALIMLTLSLGLRVTSVSEIDLEDVDFENNSLKIVEKGNKIRTLEFSDNIKDLLLDWVKDREELMKFIMHPCDALFVSYQLERMKVGGIRKMLTKYTHNIDKHITPHKLRSTCATNIYEKTGDIYLVANVLGHSNLANTKRYTAVSNDKQKQAARAMDDILF